MSRVFTFSQLVARAVQVVPPARLLRYDALAIAFAHEPEEIAAAPGQVVDEADT